MEVVGVWEGKNPCLGAAYALLGRERQDEMDFLAMESPEAFLKDEPLAFLAIAPDAKVEGDGRLPGCRLLLLPGEQPGLIHRVKTSCAMSYGTSPKDSLTVSSMDDDHVAVSIQRELVTLTGGTVERQEVILPVKGIKEPLTLLAWVGLLLVLGMPVGDIPSLAETHFVEA